MSIITFKSTDILFEILISENSKYLTTLAHSLIAEDKTPQKVVGYSIQTSS